MTVLQQLDKRLVDLGFVVLGGVVVWAITQKMAGKVEKVAQAATQPVGELISDLAARYNGWSPVELQPLMIRDFYLTHDHRLTPEAEETLWKIDQYRPLMLEIFGYPQGVMAEKYRPLINQPISEKHDEV